MMGRRTIGLALAAMLASTDAGYAASGKLTGFQEVPPVATTGQGKCTVKASGESLAVTVDYANLKGAVQQAHVHFGQAGVTGAIMFFICTNLGNGPAGTPPCPAPPVTVTRTIVAADLLAQGTQGVAAGDLPGFLLALKKKVTYCDVHSTNFPSGEIRTQLK